MPLEEPPSPQRLRRAPRWRLARRQLWRVYRAGRGSPWWFAALDGAPEDCGRFDLPPPDGACYTARRKLAAVLEALQGFGRGLIPDAELARRRVAVIDAPADASPAAWLTAARARGFGVTAALWPPATDRSPGDGRRRCAAPRGRRCTTASSTTPAASSGR